MSDFPIFISFLTAGALTLVIILMVAFMRSILYVCAPNEILIFSGMKRVTPEGREVGFRVIHGGRGFRVPILEKVDRMDMRLITVPMTVRNAYSEGGIPLTVNAIANIKISSDEQYRGNAIERFLGHKPQSIARVAKETLEGHLRGVVATMTPEEVNEDRLKFAEQMAVEAVGDLQKARVAARYAQDSSCRRRQGLSRQYWPRARSQRSYGWQKSLSPMQARRQRSSRPRPRVRRRLPNVRSRHRLRR